MAFGGDYLICDVLKNVRIETKHSFKNVYDKTGISDSRLHRFEEGNIKALSIDEIYKLTEFYGIDFESILLQSGYLKKDRGVFKNTQRLSKEDVDHIQKEIDYIVGLKEKSNDF